MTQIVNKIIKTLVLILWFIAILTNLVLVFIFYFIPDANLYSRFINVISSIVIVGGFELITFILDIPYLVALIGIFYVASLKIKNKYLYFYITFAFNIISIIAAMIIIRGCELDDFCRLSDPPLGSSIAWARGMLIGHVILTFPLMYFIHTHVIGKKLNFF
jgi:hypothetical protein